MSHLTIKNDILSHIIATVSTAGIGYEIGISNENSTTNDDGTGFLASDYSIWLESYYFPVDSVSLGKGQGSLDDEHGFYQVSVFVKQDSPVMYNKQLELIDIIKLSMWNGAVIGDTYVKESTVNNGRPKDGWYARDLTINFNTYIRRG